MLAGLCRSLRRMEALEVREEVDGAMLLPVKPGTRFAAQQLQAILSCSRLKALDIG